MVSIIEGDCREKLQELIDKGVTVDMTITSPPYDDMRSYGNTLEWNLDICKDIIKLLYKITKPGGVVVWVINDKTKKGSETTTSFKQALAFVETGFNLNDTMIWKKENPLPQVKQPRYNQVFEYMFVFSKGLPTTFNPIMVPCKCAGKKYDSTCKNIGGEDGRTHKTFNINKEKVKDNIWEIAVAQNKTNHPAVFPEKLAYDHILTWSNEGDTVLDPFCGSGTSGIAAIKLKRNFIGIEKVPEYCELSKNRIQTIYNERLMEKINEVSNVINEKTKK